MQPSKLKDLVLKALEELKGLDIVALNVAELTHVTDFMIVASGSSSRHVKSLAGNVVTHCKKAGVKPVGVEGEDQGEWVLVDIGAVVLHVMLPATRQFYDLQRLWETPALAIRNENAQ